jgi:hypothetical protein
VIFQRTLNSAPADQSGQRSGGRAAAIDAAEAAIASVRRFDAAQPDHVTVQTEGIAVDNRDVVRFRTDTSRRRGGVAEEVGRHCGHCQSSSSDETGSGDQERASERSAARRSTAENASGRPHRFAVLLRMKLPTDYAGPTQHKDWPIISRMVRRV